jgi:putative MATE family efflux protein
MEKENKMGVMPVKKLVVTMSLPIMISMLVQSMYNIVDSVFVAKLGESSLTATSIAYSAQILQIAVAVGTGVGVNALVSRCLGAKKFTEANEAATTGLFLEVLSSLVFIIWGIFGTEAFIRIFTSDSKIIEDGTAYLRICQLFSTGIFLGTFTQSLLQSTGRTFSSMLAQIAGALVNLILDPLLIFGVWLFPEMGITGAAVATVIGQWSAAVIGLVLNYVQNKEVHFIFKGFRFKRENLKLVYKVGAPTIIMQSFGSVMLSCMNMILVGFSTTAVAFFGVYFKLQSFIAMPMNGLGRGILPIVSYNFGAKKPDRIKETVKTALIMGCVICAVVTLVICGFTKQILLMFSASDKMLAMGIPALRIISLTFILTAATMVSGYVVSGLGTGSVTMLATAIRQLIILLPCVIIIGKIGGISYVWFAFWLSEGCALVYAITSLRKKLKPVINMNNF